MKSLFRELVVHFLALGGLLFGIGLLRYAWGRAAVVSLGGPLG